MHPEDVKDYRSKLLSKTEGVDGISKVQLRHLQLRDHTKKREDPSGL